MAEKSSVWTESKKAAAVAGKYYIKVGDKRGTLKLSGAAKKWKADPTFTYVSDLRIAGSPAALKAFLKSQGRTDSQTDTIISSAGWNRSHLEDRYYLAELAALKSAGGKVAAKRASSTAPAHSIAWYAQKVDEAKVQGGKAKSPRRKSASPKKKAAKKSPKKATKKAGKKTASPKKRKTVSPKKAAKKTKTASPKKAKKTKSASPKRSKSASPKKAKKSASPKKTSPKGKRKTLSEKLASLPAGKVLDVSAYRASDKKSTVIAAPTGKSKKVVAGRISANPDALVGVKAAAKDLGDETLVAQWKAARGGKAASPRSPAATLPLSPASARSSPRALPVQSGSPRSSGKLPSLPVARPPTIGSPRSPRSPKL